MSEVYLKGARMLIMVSVNDNDSTQKFYEHNRC